MLQQWSTDILDIWTEVYALVLAKLIKDDVDKLNNQDECRKTVAKMADRNQSIKVRTKVASLLGFLEKYESLGTSDLYKRYFISDSKQKTRIVSVVC